jgi:hypothetical protein
VEFRFGPKEHSLQVSAKSAEKSGHGEEWVNAAVKNVNSLSDEMLLKSYGGKTLNLRDSPLRFCNTHIESF